MNKIVTQGIICLKDDYNFEYKISRFTKYDKELEKIISNKFEQKIYVLDIEMDEISGLEIASEIRESDGKSVIIFVTLHPEFQNDIFYSRLLALDFISKDGFWESRFQSTIKYAIKKENSNRVLAFDYNHNSYRIPFDSITYIEKVQSSPKCIINTIDEKKFEIAIPIGKLEEKLGYGFFRTHKACIVNIEKIENVIYAENKITFVNGDYTYLLSDRKKRQLREYVTNY